MPSRQPPEWGPHAAVWTAWPSDPDLWAESLEPARAEVAALVRALAPGEPVRLLVATEEAAASAEAAVGGGNVTLTRIAFGDIWLRDTAPLFLSGPQNILTAARFRFNGWGGKYQLPGDEGVGEAIAVAAGIPCRSFDWVLEGGAIDVDGTGLAVTTEQCLLNPNRNNGMSRGEVEIRLSGDLGIDHLLWLGEGLANDHTDGHVDNLARFVAPGVLALPEASEADDPNREVFRDAHRRAGEAGLEIVAMPSVGRYEDEGGRVMPASYMNFYIGNRAIVVPLYDRPNDDKAVAAVQALFPDRAAIGLPARHLLTGGGSFHCITQQQPRIGEARQP